MDNMEIWNKVNKPPIDALKTIGGGRLKGMTDIKPQWRFQAMTEVFGPCGIGWKYTVDKLWTEQGSLEQVMCFVSVSLYIKQDDKWSEPIPGVGGSMLVTKESAGLHSSDEGFKMALTDALSVAMKAIGVASEVYMGNWDGSKYKEKKENIGDSILEIVKVELFDAKKVEDVNNIYKKYDDEIESSPDRDKIIAECKKAKERVKG